MAGYLLSLALAFVLVAAVAGHLHDSQRIGEAARAAGAPIWIGWLAGGAEAGLVAALVLTPSVGGLLAASYLLILTTALVAAKLAGRKIDDCGCGRKRHPLNLQWLARNSLLVVAAGTVAATAPKAYPKIGLSLAVVALVVTANELRVRSRNGVVLDAT